MSRTVSDKLHKLIHSLEKTEKRYFKVDAKRHVTNERNYYVELFELIENQKTYNEQEILDKLGFSKKQLADLKNYLYKSILKSLRHYNGSSNINAKLFELLENVSLLYKKGLITQCHEERSKLAKLAKKYNQQHFLIEADKWGLKLKLAFGGLSDNEIKTSNEASLSYAKAYKREIELRNINLIITRKQNEILDGNKNAIVETQKLVEEILKGGAPTTFSGKLYFNNALGTYFRAIKNVSQAYDYRKEELKIWQQAPHQQKENPESYLSSLVSYFNILNQEQRYKEANEYINKISYTGKSKKIRSQYDALIFNLRLVIATNTGDIEYGLSTIKKIKKASSTEGFIPDVQNLLQLQINSAFVYFLNNDYRKAIREISVFLNNPYAKLAGNYASVKIFQLLVHYELKDLELLPYIIRSVYRYLRSSDKLNGFETLVLKFIRETINITSSQDMKKRFEKLKVELISLRDDPYERWAMDRFRMVEWLESKIQPPPFDEIIRNRFLGN